ncbi:hypothetical protein [Streptomyces sp. NPDC001750]|uniref:hypothetical protein n=1 Tax=Streptomyces sp. NPDC001750 TaxID=3364607 RepID=UPI0036B3A56B
MITFLSVLVWVAEAVGWVLSLGWWFVSAAALGVVVGAWLWLRPTGKRRRPFPRRAASPVADIGQDAIVFQDVIHAGVPIPSNGGEADR